LTRSTGYDHLQAFRRETGSPAVCGYLPDYCSRAVAEHAMLLMMALWRKLNLQINQFSRFKRDGLTGTEFYGKNLLVVGVGRIGSKVAGIARGCGMAVRGVDIAPRMKGLKYVSLRQGLFWAHAVICAVPLTSLTRGMFHYEAFRGSRKGLIFINIARGEISPAGELCRLLDEGTIAGAGLDVFEKEDDVAVALRRGRRSTAPWLKNILELKAKQNVILTPHNAFNTHEALERKARQSIQAISHFLKAQTFPHPVPDSDLDPKECPPKSGKSIIY